ncbi:MAG: FUN14 domain-containing protein [Myxococcales bacterium]|nr:FUN14 domain-containing protein [Myxococcales bacterium]MCB9549874.1 FUN14 domain-containing protein [Myxococcales bacterium]
MSDGKKLVPFLSRPLVISIAALAWTVMVGSAVARYLMAQGLVDEHALAQRADNIKTYRDRLLDSVRFDRPVTEDGEAIPEGDAPPDAPPRGLGSIQRGLDLSLRRARAENLLSMEDPAVQMDEPTLRGEIEKAAEKVRSAKLMQSILPYLSEGGLLLLLGIGLGLASRMVFKIGIVVGILVIGGMQYLAWQGLLEVNWGQFAGLLHETLLNMTPQGDLTEILKQKFPSLGTLALGYFLGVRG